MLLECTAMSAFSSIFNLSRSFRTSDFRAWILSLQIYNFISVLQTQIGENADNLSNIESYIMAGNNRQLTILVRTETSRRILTK